MLKCRFLYEFQKTVVIDKNYIIKHRHISISLNTSVFEETEGYMEMELNTIVRLNMY